jgi:hypothetical protein
MWRHTRRNGAGPFKSASVQSTTGSRGVRIGGSNAGYTMFRGSEKGTGWPLHSPVSPSHPLPCITACHHISTGVYLPHSRAVLSPRYSEFGKQCRPTQRRGLGRNTTERYTWYTLDTIIPAVRVELSLVALIQYLVKTVSITERWDMLPLFFSGQEQVSWLEHGFGLKHYRILKLLHLCWYFL